MRGSGRRGSGPSGASFSFTLFRKFKAGRLRPAFFVLGMALFLGMGVVSPPVWAQAQNVTYTYDDLGRLSTVTYSTGETIQYTYDPAGNRTAQVISGTVGGTSMAGLTVIVLPISGFIVLPIKDPNCSLIAGGC